MDLEKAFLAKRSAGFPHRAGRHIHETEIPSSCQNRERDQRMFDCWDSPMSSWYEVYDNVDIQSMTRKRAAALTGVVTIVIMVSITALAVGMEGSLPLPAAALIIVLAWAGFAWWCTRRYRSLRRQVWCVKLSQQEIVGYDYARRRSELEWLHVECIDIGDSALLVVGPGHLTLEIAHLFPDFAELSHRILYYAESYDVPVHVNGRPWEQLDVYSLFPFLQLDTPSSPTHGSTSR